MNRPQRMLNPSAALAAVSAVILATPHLRLSRLTAEVFIARLPRARLMPCDKARLGQRARTARAAWLAARRPETLGDHLAVLDAESKRDRRAARRAREVVAGGWGQLARI